MFDAARLRLTAWYLAILTAIVGLLSVALYHILVRFPTTPAPANALSITAVIAYLSRVPNAVLASQIAAVDLGVLILAALGAYVLAGKTLAPIAAVLDRQQRFAALASHQLRTPLTVLRGTMEVALLRQRTAEEYEQVLRDAVADVDRLSTLVADLLAAVRIQRDTIQPNLTLLDLRDVARDVVESVRPLAAQKQQTIELNLNGPLLLPGDGIKLRQVAATLLDNALAYTPGGGHIEVSAHQERGRAFLSVRDSGPGIAPEHLPHLFEPLYRADVPGADASGHAGLGLALAAWIVRSHRGKLRVRSKVGRGSTFTVSLPLLPSRKRRLLFWRRA